MLKQMLAREEERAWAVFMEGRLLISKLEEEIQTRQVKATAAAYWRAARDAEDAMAKHRSCKFSLDIPLTIKQNVYEHMIDCLKYLKEKESAYKESVDNANSFLHGEFRTTINRLIQTLVPQLEAQPKDEEKSNSSKPDSEQQSTDNMGIEEARCEAVHEAINKFVVYEKFAEMTHKYDISHFGKLLDDYNSPDELLTIRRHLAIDPPIKNASNLDDTPEGNFENEEEKEDTAVDAEERKV